MPAPLYRVSIDLGSETVSGKGHTVFEALSSITKPVKIVGKTNLKITKGKKSTEMTLMPTRAKRLFYPLAQMYLAKQFETILK